MQEYKNKAELLAEIEKTYRLFVKEFDDVDEREMNTRIAEVDKTPQEMIAYQLGWLNLILNWEKSELAGENVITPSPDYKWNQLGSLYRQFYAKYSGLSLQELRGLFDESLENWRRWIEKLDEAELFEPNRRKWTVTKANWPIWKWIHINSVAPFKSFRSKIRKWKKYRKQKSKASKC